MIRGVLQNVVTAAAIAFGVSMLAPTVVAGVQIVGCRAVGMRHPYIALLASVPAGNVVCIFHCGGLLRRPFWLDAVRAARCMGVLAGS